MNARLPAAIFMAASCVVLALGLNEFIGTSQLAFDWGGAHYELLESRRLLLLALLPCLPWLASFSLADLPRAQRRLGVVVRSLLLASLVIALSRPARTRESSRISTIVLVDVSDSVSDEALEASRGRLLEILDASREDDDVQLVTFAEEARVVPLTLPLEVPPVLDRHPERGAGTNLSAALRLAYGLYPPGHIRRALLLSDGSETHGDLLGEASRAVELGVRLDALPIREGVPPEVAVVDLTLPNQIRVGEPFRIHARLYASRATRARIRLYQGETLNGLDGVRDVEVEAGESELTFESVVRMPGPVTYRVTLSPQGEDSFASNNHFEASAIVPGRPSVLYVEGTRGRGAHFARALTAADFAVDVRSPRAIPTSLRELERYDFFILSDVPADQVSASQIDTIERYVRDVGGGFMMVGGARSFGLGGWQGTRMERLLPVRLDSERRRDQPSLALALVIDRSGSMNGQKIELAKEAAKATAELLGADDYISVIGFDARPERIVRMQSARNRMRILRDIGRMSARGGTAIFPALDMAYQDLAVTRARIKHVILLTDGQSPERGISELVQVMRSEAITVSTVGLGSDVNRALLESLATLGGGRSYITQDAHNIPRIFMRETTTVARSSAVEEYFQPVAVERADFLRGIPLRSAPFLHGYVATRRRPSPAQVILASDLGEPLLARWRVGLGWSMAWTSDVKSRWASEWLRWPSFSRFWAQLIREHMRHRREQRLDMSAEINGDEVRVVVDAIDRDDHFLNGLESTLSILGPMRAAGSPLASRGQETRRQEEHALRQTAPGRYEARFALHRYGSFVLEAAHHAEGRLVAESGTHISNPYPAEYARLEPDLALLGEAASLTGGRVDPLGDSLFDPGEERIERHEELWSWLLLVALGIFLFDLLLRRVRLFDRNFAGS